MWTRARFNDEYVPGLFALAIDTYLTKRTQSMWRDLVTLKTSKKKKGRSPGLLPGFTCTCPSERRTGGRRPPSRASPRTPRC